MKNEPVPQSLLARWSKCPAEKIFGYHRFWVARESAFGHPLIPKVRQFFEDNLPLAEEMSKSEGRFEIQKFFAEWNGVREESAIVLGKKVDGSLPAGKPWDAILEKWISATQGIQEALEENRELAGQSPEIYKAYTSSFSRASTLVNKLQTLKSRLGFQSETKSIMERLIVDLHEAVEKTVDPEHPAPPVTEAEIAARRESYRAKVEAFHQSLAANPREYHEMMSIAGSITDKQKKARELFIEGVNFHWERRWDESLAKFRAVLELLPADGPSKSYIERVEGYKTEPPSEKWQGEFVQKKK